jgi:hypothetical protein
MNEEYWRLYMSTKELSKTTKCTHGWGDGITNEGGNIA